MLALDIHDLAECMTRTTGATGLATDCGAVVRGSLWFCSRSCEEYGSHVVIYAPAGETPRVAFPESLHTARVSLGYDETGAHWAIIPAEQACRDCGVPFPYDVDADRCPVCVTATLGERVQS